MFWLDIWAIGLAVPIGWYHARMNVVASAHGKPPDWDYIHDHFPSDKTQISIIFDPKGLTRLDMRHYLDTAHMGIYTHWNKTLEKSSRIDFGVIETDGSVPMTTCVNPEHFRHVAPFKLSDCASSILTSNLWKGFWWYLDAVSRPFSYEFQLMKILKIGFSAGRSTFKSEAIVGRFSSSKGTMMWRG